MEENKQDFTDNSAEAMQNNQDNQSETTAQSAQTYEQKPSQLYGRTAYQEQMRREQMQQEQVNQNYNPYGAPNYNQGYNPNGAPNCNQGYNPNGAPNYNQGYNPNGAPNYNQGYNPYGVPNYNQGYNPYGNPYGNPYANSYQGVYEQTKAPVSNTFAIVLMAIFGLRCLLTLVQSWMTVDFIQYASDIYELEAMLTSISVNYPEYTAISLVISLASIAFYSFAIADIYKINKAGYKVTGLILFTILFPIGYFIWRAYLLKQKKTGAIIFTVIAGIFMMVEFAVIFGTVFQVVLQSMSTMYY